MMHPVNDLFGSISSIMAKTIVKPSNPHFFKFILPATPEGDQRLSIPKAFVKDYLEGEKYEEKIATLRTRKSGKSWIVSTEGYCFTDGWEDFHKEHDLNPGYLLVSKHEGGLKFEVIVFDTTMCEKVYPKEKDDAQVFMEKAEAVEIKQKKVAHEFPSSKSTASMVKGNKDPSCVSIVIQPSDIHWKCWHIPSGFGRENGLDKKSIKPCMITLKGPKGKSWEVGLRHKGRYGRPYLGLGWSKFVGENKLKIGDVCTFKLVSKGYKEIVMEFTVSRRKSTV